MQSQGQMHVAVSFVVVNTQDMLAMPIVAFSAF